MVVLYNAKQCNENNNERKRALIRQSALHADLPFAWWYCADTMPQPLR